MPANLLFSLGLDSFSIHLCEWGKLTQVEAKLPRDEQTKACATKAVFRDVKMAFNYPTCRDKIERLMGQPSELPLVQLDELQRSLVALLTTPKYVANTRGLKKKNKLPIATIRDRHVI